MRAYVHGVWMPWCLRHHVRKKTAISSENPETQYRFFPDTVSFLKRKNRRNCVSDTISQIFQTTYRPHNTKQNDTMLNQRTSCLLLLFFVVFLRAHTFTLYDFDGVFFCTSFVSPLRFVFFSACTLSFQGHTFWWFMVTHFLTVRIILMMRRTDFCSQYKDIFHSSRINKIKWKNERKRMWRFAINTWCAFNR